MKGQGGNSLRDGAVYTSGVGRLACAVTLPETDPPPVAAPAPLPEDALLLPAMILERLDWAGVFGNARPVEVELGAGDGSFLLDWAAAHPERNFLGIERLLGRVRKIDRKGRRRGLTNLRGLRLEAAYVLERMIPPGTAAALHVYFPDPWPKTRHHKRRLVNARFVELVHRALAPEGVVHLRTDDAPYFAQMEEVFGGSPLFRRTETPADLAACVTDFERGFNARGIPTLRSSWRRV